MNEILSTILNYVQVCTMYGLVGLFDSNGMHFIERHRTLFIEMKISKYKVHDDESKHQ
jgi:hypothetical protein